MSNFGHYWPFSVFPKNWPQFRNFTTLCQTIIHTSVGPAKKENSIILENKYVLKQLEIEMHGKLFEKISEIQELL